jgi:phosphoinositide-3-kinase regulatory subunit 4
LSADGPALVILSLICANIRNCTQPSSKVKALDLLLAVAPHLTDEAKLDRLVPYVVDLLHDDAALVRASAIRSLIQVVSLIYTSDIRYSYPKYPIQLMLVTTITPSNAFIFPEYILPNVRDITRDKDVTVRCMYAQCIVSLADTSVRYLEMSQAIKAHGTFKLTDTQDYDDAVYEAGCSDWLILLRS